VQTNPPLVAAVIAGRAAFGLIERELAILSVAALPVGANHLAGCHRVKQPVVGVRQIISALKQQLVDFGDIWVTGFVAILAQALAQALSENAKQGIGKVEWGHPHVEQVNDRL